MRPIAAWESYTTAGFVWWALSENLYRRIFSNLGFDIEILPVSASLITGGKTVVIPRSTIVARRRAA